jgi:periplasmic divalent cation tolerance protein
MTTIDSLEEAKALARKLLNTRLCACANIVPNLYSMYWWKGEIEEAQEWLIVMKTEDEKSVALLEAIDEIHPYETPEGVVIDIEDSLEAYDNWVWRETRGES